MSDKPIVLSAIDFLALSETSSRLVKFVDFSVIGREGGVYVRELGHDNKQAVMSMKSGKAHIHADKSMLINLADMPKDSGPKFLRYGLVTDETGDTLMFDKLKKLCNGKTHIVIEKLKAMPNPVIDLIVKEIRLLSRMNDYNPSDEVENQKKG